MLPKPSVASVRARAVEVFCCVVLCAGGLAAQQKPADLILRNGKILTVDKNFTIAQAVAITGNQISAVGSDADVMKQSGPNTQVIDLKGRTVTPGLISTHIHSIDMNYAAKLSEPERAFYRVDWGAVRTKEDVLNQISGIIKKYNIKPGTWVRFANTVTFMGEGNEVTQKQANIMFNELNRWELDKAAPKNPIIMTEGIPDVNGLLLNGVATDILWKEYGDFVKQYGRYWIDSSGRPEGHIEAIATRMVLAHYNPHPTPETLAPMFKMQQEEWLAQGMTGVSGRYSDYTVATWKLLDSRNQMLGRVAYGVEDRFGSITNLETGLKQLKGLVGTGTEKVWVNSVSMGSNDGAGSRMCTNLKKAGSGAIDSLYPMGQCYTDSEFKGAAGKGGPVAKNYFQNWVTTSAKYGVRFANTHSAGDRSNNTMLKWFEQADKMYGAGTTKGWELDHCNMINPADLPLAAKLGVGFSCSITGLEGIEGSQDVADDFGQKVADTYISAVNTMIKLGIHPSMDSATWRAVEMAITRNVKGKVWGPDERLSRQDALRMATVYAAGYILKGDKLGSIEPGKLADLVVLDKDYMTMPEDQIHTMEPRMTIFDGKIVFVHKDFSQEYNLRPAGAIITTFDELYKRPEHWVGGQAQAVGTG